MNQYKITANYNIANPDGGTVTKQMLFLVPANSFEEACIAVEAAATPYINKVNGIFVSAE